MTRPAPSWFCILSWLAVCGWSNAVVFLSSLSGPEVEKVMPFPVWDKTLHAFAFSVGGFALGMALRGTADWAWQNISVFGWALLVAFAGLDELHQLLVPHRSGADVGDWLADAFGAAVGLAIAAFFYARYLREDPPAPATA